MNHRPKGATVIPNALGTAPGFILEGKATVFVLPGVPAQTEIRRPTKGSVTTLHANAASGLSSFGSSVRV